MPISLIPISRRRFLKASIGTAAGLWLGSRNATGAATPPRDPDRFALLSDIHINADATKTDHAMNMTDNLRNAIEQILAAAKGQPPHAAAIISGDCAHLTGQTEDYAAMLRLLEPLSDSAMPIHLAVGNHDQRERFWAAVPSERLGPGGRVRAMNTRHMLILRTPRADWIVLDSLNKTNQTPGLLGGQQIEWLKRTLDASPQPEKPVIVVAHHDPQITLPSTRPASTRPATLTGLADADSLLKALLPRKQVKAMVFGHTHYWSVRRQEGLYLVNLPACAYIFRAGMPCAWVDCRLGETGARLQLHCIDPKHTRNGETVDLAWRR